MPKLQECILRLNIGSYKRVLRLDVALNTDSMEYASSLSI